MEGMKAFLPALLGAFLDLNSPLSAEICGRGGYDWLIIDLEHGAATEADLLPLLLAVGVTPAAALGMIRDGALFCGPLGR